MTKENRIRCYQEMETAEALIDTLKSKEGESISVISYNFMLLEFRNRHKILLELGIEVALNESWLSLLAEIITVNDEIRLIVNEK